MVKVVTVPLGFDFSMNIMQEQNVAVTLTFVLYHDTHPRKILPWKYLLSLYKKGQSLWHTF